MLLKSITSFLRKRGEKKRGLITRQAEALGLFLFRLEEAFPESLQRPGKISLEIAEVSRKRLIQRRESNASLSRALAGYSIDARLLASTAIEASTNRQAFVRRWVGEFERRGCNNFSQVKPVDTFSKVLVAIRALYAEDIQNEILVRDVVKVVVEKVLVSPAKRA
jgi:hypothetical protein